ATGVSAQSADPDFQAALREMRRDLDDLQYENMLLNQRLQHAAAPSAGSTSPAAGRILLAGAEIVESGPVSSDFSQPFSTVDEPRYPDNFAIADSGSPLITRETPGRRFHVTTEWLYLRVNRNGLDYATLNSDGINTTTPQTFTLGPTELYHIEPNLDSGLRLGLGYRTQSGVNLGLTWTTYSSGESDVLFDPTGAGDGTRQHGDNNYFPDAGDGNGLLLAHSRYGFDLDVIDLDAGREFALRDGLSLQLFGGLRIADLHQRMDTSYLAIFGDGEALFLKEKSDVKAFGFSAGTGVRWNPWRRLGFFGRLRGSLMAASTDRSMYERAEGPVNTFGAGEELSVLASTSERLVISSVEVAAGASFLVHETRQTAVSLDTGYELQSWMNIPDFLQFTDNSIEGRHTRSLGSIGLDGLFVRLKGEF
ncbi:MAG: hypothetical protein KDA79_12195, partial [Planctomycetaceae bacterium]|nr:hypothetical protein [Planctomycetaceae bacterium]